MPGPALWLAALCFSIAAIHLARDAARRPAQGVGFDRPLLRALILALAWAALAMALIFAMLRDGALWPPLAAGGLWLAAAGFLRRGAPRAAHALTAPLAALAFVCVFFLFQDVFGDAEFGIIRANP